MDEKRFTMRMDAALYKEISESAEENKRSVAKEIEVAMVYYLTRKKYNRTHAIVENFLQDEENADGYSLVSNQLASLEASIRELEKNI